MDVDETSGRVSVQIRNTGAAGWRDQNLSVELQSREGLSLGIYDWPDFTLEAGERTVLEHPDMRLAAPFDACVVIDPYDEVVERSEEGGVVRAWACVPRQLPDLIISDVTFEGGDEGVGRLARHRREPGRRCVGAGEQCRCRCSCRTALRWALVASSGISRSAGGNSTPCP